MQPFPANPAEPVYTFHITPSTPEARERIADGAEQPALLRGTLAQGRDLARLLDASISLLDGRGRLAIGIERSGDFWRVGEMAEAGLTAETRRRFEAVAAMLAAGRAYGGGSDDASGYIAKVLRGEARPTTEARPAAYPIVMVNAAAVAAERLENLGWNTATVTFHATGFALAGAYFNDGEAWFKATVSEAKDEAGGSVVGLKFRSQNRDRPLVAVEHADDIATGILTIIDNNL